MNIRNLNIKDASSAALEALMQDISVELQERELRVNCEDALNHHLSVGELPDDSKMPYIAYLESRSDLPLAKILLDEWEDEQAQDERALSMRTTGA
jgi:hypothetical protein